MMFSIASTGMALVVGVALGNVVRGVPIDDSGWVEIDLFSVGANRVGAIDAYTLLLGAFAVVVLAAHGVTYLAWKTESNLHARSVAVARWAWLVAAGLFVAATAATALQRPDMARTFLMRPWLWPLPCLAAAAPFCARSALVRRRELSAFLASSAFIASLLTATAGTLYPALLHSTLGSAHDIDAHRFASGTRGLEAALGWWAPAMALALAYFVNLFRSVRGKVRLGDSPH